MSCIENKAAIQLAETFKLIMNINEWIARVQYKILAVPHATPSFLSFDISESVVILEKYECDSRGNQFFFYFWKTEGIDDIPTSMILCLYGILHLNVNWPYDMIIQYNLDIWPFSLSKELCVSLCKFLV